LRTASSNLNGHRPPQKCPARSSPAGAIFGVTREPFIVFSATALALVGLRSLYFLLAGVRDRFTYLDTGLAVTLVFIGSKFLLTDVVEIGVGLSLLVIVLVMSAAIGATLLQERRRPRGPEPHARGRD
jgi:tellurite resistance protein TerC